MQKKLTDLESAYAEMARDKKREKDALEWAEISRADILSQEDMHKVEQAIKIQLDIH